MHLSHLIFDLHRPIFKFYVIHISFPVRLHCRVIGLKRFHPLMPVDFEALPFSKLLWCRVLCHCLEERVEHWIVVRISMDCLEAAMDQTGETKHRCHHGIAPAVEVSTWLYRKIVVLECYMYFLRNTHFVVDGNCDQILLSVSNGIAESSVWSESFPAPI
jgi:hypothetical protein